MDNLLRSLVYALIVFLYVPSFYAQDIIINEVIYSNKAILTDGDNDTPDWIEIYNRGDKIINLEDYQLNEINGGLRSTVRHFS